jgi:peptidoglycan LD-endopeptidase LytH
MKEKQDGLRWSYLLTAARNFIFLAATVLFIAGCGEIESLITSRTPYEKYLNSLTDSGVINTAAGDEWKQAGVNIFNDTLLITLPYKEVLYFSPSRIYASGYMLPGKRGENIRVNVERDTTVTSQLFADLFFINNGEFEHVTSAGTEEIFLNHTISKTGMYFLRIQPELLGGGKFYLNISNYPSLAFPVEGKDSRAIRSFWGDRRDGGTREHKGVDIFADRGTPVLAAEDGVITRTGTNNLGGKVVWLSTLTKSLYYAHLDSQAINPAQVVKKGDTLGFVGNTGNARFTPPHLHFGIYYRGEGAVDPFPYVKNYFASAAEPKVNDELLGSYARTIAATPVFFSPEGKRKNNYPANTPLFIKGSTDKYYKVLLYNGSSVYIPHKAVSFNFNSVAHKNAASEILSNPHQNSYITGIINTGDEYIRIGTADKFTLISFNDTYGWIRN